MCLSLSLTRAELYWQVFIVTFLQPRANWEEGTSFEELSQAD